MGDRDEYVKINFGNITQNNKDQFTKCEQCQIPKLADGTNLPYECSSLMHYESDAFGRKEWNWNDATRKWQKTALQTIKDEKCPPNAPLKDAGQEATENDWTS